MILDTLKSILEAQLDIDPESITEDTNIMDDLGADSLDVVEMLMTIEQEHGIVVPDEAILTFKTVGDVARYLENNQ